MCKLYKKHRSHAERGGPPGNGTGEGKGNREEATEWHGARRSGPRVALAPNPLEGIL